MCGIAGIIGNKSHLPPHSDAEIRHVLGAQAHRGPDASAVRKIDDRAILAAARLRITDARNIQADMPMTSSCGRFTIVHNGEVYNHKEIRKSLRSYPFKTHCDTETILAAWVQWGPDCLSRFEGMFAFCIYDQVNKTAFLAIDPSGQKFIYYIHDRDSLLFSSEIEPIITDPCRIKNWDIEGLEEYMHQRMILGQDTHIREIKKLEAGTLATLRPGGELSIRRYNTIAIGDQAAQNQPEIIAKISEAIQKGCRDTFDLEVSAGLLLSGGIDSSAVGHYAQQAGLKLDTYSIGFKKFTGENFGIPTVFNEFDYARFMADTLKTNHHEISLTPEQYCDLVDRWIEICGEPLESSEAPMLIELFKTGAQNHKVMFCGSGPDEAFDGYGFGKILADVKPGNTSQAYVDRLNWAFSVDLSRLMPESRVRDRAISKLDGFLKNYPSISDPLQQAQLINLHGRCVAYEYRQMDVISMRYGVEARSPLADTRLTRAAFDFNPALKQHNGEDKWIYKQALRGAVPDKIVDRQKIGFPTPIEFWFTNIFESRVREELDANSPMFSTGFIDQSYVRQIGDLRDPAYRCLDYRFYTLSRLMKRQEQYVGTQSRSIDLEGIAA